MKARIFSLIVVVGLALLVTLLAGGTKPTAAQGPEPPGFGPQEPLCPPESPCGTEGPRVPWRKSSDGPWFMPEGARPPMEAASAAPQTTGGPDDFGYTWDDTVPFNWIDATGGTDTGLGGSTYVAGPFPIGFSFKHYENTYTQLWVSRYGLLGFNSDLWYSWGSIPSPTWPNDIIAPYWTYLTMDAASKVYYLSGGSPPNRYFVVQWHQVHDGLTDNTFTFQAILWENGDILFQYHTMSYGPSDYYCARVGIEDSLGSDGLQYQSCGRIPSNKAIRFYRPAPSARVKVWPLYQGRFTAGETVAFQVLIRNTGELGSDTYDLFVSSPWSVSFYAADGTTPLTDTDVDGTVDTSSVAQGGSTTIVVKVTTPGTANVGDNNTAAVTVRSSLDTSKSKTVSLQTAIPAPFAQVFQDNADGAMSLYLVQPSAQALKKVTDDYYWGYYMAVAEMPGSFAYFWTRYRWLGDVSGAEIEYTLLDSYGETARAVSKLTDHTGATMPTYDFKPAVAVAPNGHIGVVWYRYLWNSSTSQFNYNIYFAVLDATGALSYGPVNITNNTTWGTWDDQNVPNFQSPRVTATDDNRFILAWLREHWESGGGVDDIYYAVRSSYGSEIVGPTRLTYDTPGGSGYYAPNLARLSSARAVLTWVSRAGGNDDIYYAILNSSGGVVKSATDISVDETVVDWWNYDVTQLSDGRILVAWEAWGCFPDEWTSRIRFSILDSSYNRVVAPTCLGRHRVASGDTGVSVAADASGHAILTWMDGGQKSNYYAMVGSDGNVLTPPMIFYSSRAESPYVVTSFEGYGNTSYSLSVTCDAEPNPTKVGHPVDFTCTASGGATPYTYFWDFGDGGTSALEDPTHTYTTTGTYTATVTVTDDLDDEATCEVVVEVKPELSVSCDASPNPTKIGHPVNFTCIASGGIAPYTYFWDFGDGGTSALEDPTHTYTTTGTYTVTVTVTDDLGNEASCEVVVEVNPELSVSCGASPNPTAVGHPVDFTCTASGGVTPYTYFWDFRDGWASTLEDPIYAYATTGTYAVKVTVTDDLDNKASCEVVVEVKPKLSVSCGASPNPTKVGHPVDFTCTASGGVTPYTYFWEFGDGGTSTLEDPTYAYATTGTYTVKVTVTDDLGNEASCEVVVEVKPKLSVSCDASPNPTKTGHPVNFTCTASGGIAPYTYFWEFGDGGTSTLEDPTHTYTTTGTYTATVTVTDGLDNEASCEVVVEVNPELSVSCGASPNPTEVGHPVDFTCTASGGVTPYSYSWEFGDGETSALEDPTHTYTTTGTYTVKVTVTDDLDDEATCEVVVEVNPELSVSCGASPNPTAVGHPVDFTCTASGGVTPYTYFWDFGDGGTSTLEDPTHTYTTTGTYTVRVTVTDDLDNEASCEVVVEVNPELSVSCGASPNPTKVGHPVDFTCTASGGVTPYAYFWDFGDGGTSTLQNPTHTYTATGTYTATVTVTDSLENEAGCNVVVDVEPWRIYLPILLRNY